MNDYVFAREARERNGDNNNFPGAERAGNAFCVLAAAHYIAVYYTDL